jgi:hypothetical protein
VHSTLVSRTRWNVSSRPANMNVSPGTSMLTKYSSISPSAGPRPSRTFSSGASTMVPMFMRAWRCVRALITCTRPSESRNSRR